MHKLPISVVVVTKNEEAAIGQCLGSLAAFDEVIVVDSFSSDRTCEIVSEYSARVVMFDWNNEYPKKRQWCLDHIDFKHDWVFWVDADEVVMPALVEEMRHLQFDCAGYFVKAQYVWGGQILRYGLQNNKISLLNRHKMAFPKIDDLDCPGMGEMEGHYQPVKITEGKIKFLKATMLHYANFDENSWTKRHKKYARWEACMNKKDAWPHDPVAWRDLLKRMLRCSFIRPYLVFLYSYVFKLGFMDGSAGYDFAVHRKRYCDDILRLSKN